LIVRLKPLNLNKGHSTLSLFFYPLYSYQLLIAPNTFLLGLSLSPQLETTVLKRETFSSFFRTRTKFFFLEFLPSSLKKACDGFRKVCGMGGSKAIYGNRDDIDCRELSDAW